MVTGKDREVDPSGKQKKRPHRPNDHPLVLCTFLHNDYGDSDEGQFEFKANFREKKGLATQ